MIEIAPEDFERQKANVLDALGWARLDYIDARTETEQKIHMKAIDRLLDTAIDCGFIALQQTVEQGSEA